MLPIISWHRAAASLSTEPNSNEADKDLNGWPTQLCNGVFVVLGLVVCCGTSPCVSFCPVFYISDFHHDLQSASKKQTWTYKQNHTNNRKQDLIIIYTDLDTNTHMMLSATRPVILCCCHSNHLTFPSQTRPNETTGGQRERGKGVEGRNRHRQRQRYITGKIGRMAAGLPLSCICSLHTYYPLCQTARIIRETKSHRPADQHLLSCLLTIAPQFAAWAFPYKSNNVVNR